MQANTLVRLASSRSLEELLLRTEVLTTSTVPTKTVTATKVTPNWTEEILRYKREGTQPDDLADAHQLKHA